VTILVDSNILLRSMQPHHPHCTFAENAIAALRLRNETLCLAPQNLIEFWSVATRPENENGLGMTPAMAAEEVAKMLRLFRLLPAVPEAFQKWQQLVVSLGVSGKQAHDTHLVAFMQVYSVSNILTFNGGDFQRFPGITVLNPTQF
jgi:predicted nucleic acid-binding protein